MDSTLTKKKNMDKDIYEFKHSEYKIREFNKIIRYEVKKVQKKKSKKNTLCSNWMTIVYCSLLVQKIQILFTVFLQFIIFK